MEITIQKGISIPPASQAGRYPWKSMEVGDSFYAEMKRPGAFHTAARHQKIKISYRKEGNGYRVWRIA